MTLGLRLLVCATLLLLGGCVQTVSVDDAASRPNDEVATLLGGSFPKVRSIDQIAVDPRIFVLNPDVKVPPGPRVIVIDYQTCWTSDLCAMASVTARVDLQPGRSYALRQQAEGCDLWLALTTIVRSEPRTCRNDLWIEDGVSGERVWQGPSGDTAGRLPEDG